MRRFVILFPILVIFSLFLGIHAFKGRSPDKLGYSTPRWAQEHIATLFKQFLKNIKNWDADYLSVEAERFFSGCRNAQGWLEDWRNLTGRCMTTVDSGYIGCVGAVKYNPGAGPLEMTPDDTQELYKENIKIIIDRWRETNALRDPDVDWIWQQPSVFVGCSINPFCEKYITDGDPADELAIEGPEGMGTFENIFVLACNLGTSTQPPAEIGGGGDEELQQEVPRDFIP